MTDYPDDLRYTPSHEWVRPGDDAHLRVVRIGITDYAQSQLGDVVFVTPPEVGAVLAQGDQLAEVESTKSVSDVYAPVGGTVTAVNAELDGTPELVNSDPFGAGWMVEVELGDDESLDGLLDAEAYRGIASHE